MITKIEKADRLVIYDLSNLAYASYYSAKMSEQSESYSLESLTVFRMYKKILSHLKLLDVKKENLALLFAVDNTPKHKKELVDSYKSNRKKDELEFDPKELAKKVLKNIKAYMVECADQEADDVIATLCKKYKDKHIVIVSADHDLLQLKSPNVDILDMRKEVFWDKEEFKKKYELEKWKLIPIYKACFGDTSDNIKPALPRVRKKVVLPIINSLNKPKLSEFIEKFESSEQTGKTMQVFKDNLKNLKNNYKIVKLNSNLNIYIKANEVSEYKLKCLFEKHDIKSLKNDVRILL